jgi:MarR family transcriptional regulator, organic hydroperoxide resistance regulator
MESWRSRLGVAAQLHLSGAFVTTETNRLHEMALLKKQQDSKDRRRVLLSVTPEGRELLSSLTPIQVPVNDALFEFLKPGPFRKICEMLNSVTAAGDRAVSLLHYLADERFAQEVAEPGRRKRSASAPR